MGLLDKLAARILGKAGDGKAIAIDDLRTEADCRAALERVAKERAEARAFLVTSGDRRNALLLDDDADEDLYKLDVERERVGVVLERLERIELEIGAQATALCQAERNAAKAEYRTKYQTAAKALGKTVAAARAAHAAVLDIVDEARAQGFEHDWQTFLPPVPALANLAGDDPVLNEWLLTNGATVVPVRGSRAAGESRSPASVVPFPPRNAMSGGLMTRYGVVPAAQAAPVEQLRLPSARAPIVEVAQPGEVLLSVLRSGYESPSGKQCAPGDIIAAPMGIAAQIVGRGAANWVTPPPETDIGAVATTESEAAE